MTALSNVDSADLPHPVIAQDAAAAAEVERLAAMERRLGGRAVPARGVNAPTAHRAPLGYTWPAASTLTGSATAESSSPTRWTPTPWPTCHLGPPVWPTRRPHWPPPSTPATGGCAPEHRPGH
jgi:hypothetical protein